MKSGFIPSLFANVPPTIRFCTESQRSKITAFIVPLIVYSRRRLVEQLPLPLRKMMKWKMSTITPNIVKNTVIRSGFRLIGGKTKEISLGHLFTVLVRLGDGESRWSRLLRWGWHALDFQREMIGSEHGHGTWNRSVSNPSVNTKRYAEGLNSKEYVTSFRSIIFRVHFKSDGKIVYGGISRTCKLYTLDESSISFPRLLSCQQIFSCSNVFSMKLPTRKNPNGSSNRCVQRQSLRFHCNSFLFVSF